MNKAQNTQELTATPIVPRKQFNKELPKLTRKQAIFVKEILEHPKQSATAAAIKAYDTKDNATARAIASENLTKPNIISHLDKLTNTVETVIEKNITRYSNSDDIRFLQLSNENAKWVHDKIFGKATQRTESTSVNVNIEAMLNEYCLFLCEFW